MLKMFVSGSISVKEIPDTVKDALAKSKNKNQKILIGDAKGVDTQIQKILKSDFHYKNVEIYHIGKKPRSLIDKEWGLHPVEANKFDDKFYKNGNYTREAQMLKDFEMAKEADFGLVVWKDTSINRFGKTVVSKGSLNNIYNLLSQNKNVGICFLGNENQEIMKFNNLHSFEGEIIEKMVKKETKDYYYKLKTAKNSFKKNEVNNTEQLSLF